MSLWQKLNERHSVSFVSIIETKKFDCETKITYTHFDHVIVAKVNKNRYPGHIFVYGL